MTWLLTDARRPYLWKRASPATWTTIAGKALGHARSAADARAQAVIHLSFATCTCN
ncbi:hypothetical protein [Actinocrispum sp. NPDC049592]|uniref:hypothetical protein n=1 Tax=Actinocrispum sp. NPDC049592 TaxID=3154835 RepID=UPI0034333292